MSRNWNKREKYIMKQLGLTPQPASGAGNTWKEDGRSIGLIGQLKSTEGKGIRIDREVLKKLTYNARVSHKKPIIITDYVGHSVWISVRPMDLYDVAYELELKRKNKLPDDYKYELIGKLHCGIIGENDIVDCPQCGKEVQIVEIKKESAYTGKIVKFECGHGIEY